MHQKMIMVMLMRHNTDDDENEIIDIDPASDYEGEDMDDIH